MEKMKIVFFNWAYEDKVYDALKELGYSNMEVVELSREDFFVILGKLMDMGINYMYHDNNLGNHILHLDTQRFEQR